MNSSVSQLACNARSIYIGGISAWYCRDKLSPKAMRKEIDRAINRFRKQGFFDKPRALIYKNTEYGWHIGIWV